MKMQFSKNKFYRKIDPINQTSSYNNILPSANIIQPLFGTQYRKYDMISIANSGSICNFCNR